MTISDLRQEDRITQADGEVISIAFTTIDSDMYFWRNNYTQTKQQYHYEPNTLKHLTNNEYDIVRVERQLDGDFYPIWTKTDGDIGIDTPIIKINERYYTKRFIEKIFTQLKEWSINI